MSHGPRVEVVDSVSGKLLGSITGLKGTHGVVLDPHGRYGFISDGAANAVVVFDRGKMAVIDTETGQQIATPSIGNGPDASIYSPKFQLAFSSNGADGTLSVVDAAHHYKTVESLPTQKGARTMAYDPRTDRIYVVAAEFGPRPAATAANPHPRPSIIPDTFTILVIGR